MKFGDQNKMIGLTESIWRKIGITTLVVSMILSCIPQFISNQAWIIFVLIFIAIFPFTMAAMLYCKRIKEQHPKRSLLLKIFIIYFWIVFVFAFFGIVVAKMSPDILLPW